MERAQDLTALVVTNICLGLAVCALVGVFIAAALRHVWLSWRWSGTDSRREGPYVPRQRPRLNIVPKRGPAAAARSSATAPSGAQALQARGSS